MAADRKKLKIEKKKEKKQKAEDIEQVLKKFSQNILLFRNSNIKNLCKNIQKNNFIIKLFF